MPTKPTTRLPSTLQRSPTQARRTFAKVLDRAVQQYGDGEAARRTAFAVLKRGFEKIGDHWEPKPKKGPSDPRSKQTSTRAKRLGRGETFGGVDLYGHTRQELLERARELGLRGITKLNKQELARLIAEKQ
jgi:hypothetical protein